MKAHEGDHVVVEGARVGQGRRAGDVVRVESRGDAERLWVRWEDGHESLYIPGPDARVEPREG